MRYDPDAHPSDTGIIVTIKVPPAFYDDHAFRYDWPQLVGRCVSNAVRYRKVEFTLGQLANFASDALYYANPNVASEMRDDKHLGGVCDSARATVAALEKAKVMSIARSPESIDLYSRIEADLNEEARNARLWRDAA